MSDILAPQYLVSIVLLTSPLRYPETSWWHALAAFVFITGLPMLALWWMRRTGRVGDRHVSVRQQRTPLLLLSLASLLTGLTLLLTTGASAGLVRETLAVLAGLLLCLVVTLKWKVSVHAAVGFCTGMILLPVHAAVAVASVICWSRIRVKGHTESQVLGGTLIGLVVHYGLTVLA
ncbi:hypothetical protein LG293_16670 (plasmid) [Citricoccus nitrophenolicus]